MAGVDTCGAVWMQSRAPTAYLSSFPTVSAGLFGWGWESDQTYYCCARQVHIKLVEMCTHFFQQLQQLISNIALEQSEQTLGL